MNILEKSELNPAVEEEIKMLEQKLAEKKREAGVGVAEPQKEKELFREVVREHATQVAPFPIHSSPTAPVAGVPLVSAPASEEEKQKREYTIQKLIESALTRGIAGALQSPEVKNFYYLDELHDRLADEYYDKLIQLRKITSFL